MEQADWLSRKRTSLGMARDATSAEARLVHYDLAGRYSLKAMSAATSGMELADILPPAIYANRGERVAKVNGNG